MHPHYHFPQKPSPPPPPREKNETHFLNWPGSPQAAQLLKVYIPTIRDQHQQ